MLVQRRSGHRGHGHCLLSTVGPLWAQGALGPEPRAARAPVGVLLVTPRGELFQQAKSFGNMAFSAS